MANTQVEYLYRDGGNYKQWGWVVFRGDYEQSLHDRLVRAADWGQFVIADQVRLTELFFTDSPLNADDHCWHELGEITATDNPCDDAFGRTFAEFVCEVESASRSGWKAFDRLSRHAGL